MAGQVFPQSRSSVPDARHHVTGQLTGLPADLVGVAALLVSELAANAVLYGAGPFEVTVECFPRRRGVRVGVTDSGAGRPVLCAPAHTAEHGRGLQLVNMLAHRWGVEYQSGSKTVWFELLRGDAAPWAPLTGAVSGTDQR